MPFCKSDIGSPNVSEISQNRRGVMDDGYKNSKCEFTIQQKRYLESKLEKERNEKEDLEENFKVLTHEFSRLKDVSVKKEAKLEKLNAQLNESLEKCQLQLVTSQRENHALSFSIDHLRKTIADQKECLNQSNLTFEKRLDRIEARDRRLKESTLEWMRNIEQRQAETAEKFEAIIQQTVKVVFQGYSNFLSQSNNSKNHAQSFPPIINSITPENQKVLEMMHSGISLPPCRKKAPSPSKTMRTQSMFVASDNSSIKSQNDRVPSIKKSSKSVINSFKENKNSNLII